MPGACTHVVHAYNTVVEPQCGPFSYGAGGILSQGSAALCSMSLTVDVGGLFSSHSQKSEASVSTHGVSQCLRVGWA